MTNEELISRIKVIGLTVRRRTWDDAWRSNTDRDSPLGKGRLFVFPVGETFIENLQNRHDQPSSVYRKEVLPIVARKIMHMIPIQGHWSQMAGCKCPCSPGFVLQEKCFQGVDIYVSIS